LPRVRSVPPFVSSLGADAVELGRAAGLVADPWQADVMVDACGVRADGKWAAFEVGIVVSRQNGKGGLLELRELAGLFLWGERLLIHSAHQFDTSLEAFRRLLFLIEDTPELDQQVKRVSRSHGEEGIELKTGQRIRFRTRTSGGGRGFSGDFLALDEAMFMHQFVHGALLPTLSARPNPQVWYLGSAVDQDVHENGIVFARVRERGHRGGDPSLAYFDWSLDLPDPTAVTEKIASDEAMWAVANPALGIRISAEHVAHELASLGAREFAVERLGVGDWPRTDGAVDAVIDAAEWAALADASSCLVDPVVFAFDVAPDRSWASVAAAGRNEEGLPHVELVEHRRGTKWLPGRLEELCERHETDGVVCDAVGPAASVLHQLAGLEVEAVSVRDHVNACGLLVDLIQQKGLRHLGQPELAVAVKGATKRPLGDAWAWSRKVATTDISPLVAATLALYAASKSADWGADDYVVDTREVAA
jgi:phage terminase large subunit-like protein